MTAQLITEAIEKLEAAQDTLRLTTEQTLEESIKASQKHYEISKALSELKYVLSTL